MIDCSRCPLAHIEVDRLCSHYCKEIENFIAEIRADAIRKFSKWLQEISVDNTIPINYGKFKGQNIDDLISEYEEEERESGN